MEEMFTTMSQKIQELEDRMQITRSDLIERDVEIYELRKRVEKLEKRDGAMNEHFENPLKK